ncbi:MULTISPECIES: CAP domain-containing protein [Halomonadaceae]|uniref:CAP domain-containing protein n=1 Tax=Halomonadaceae TaxID=28256 RepID=UPI001598550C|nr:MULTISPECIES: CAP domain-containing protein [Halomonas]QJQ95960.1 CAP domain-containing protein [Halomonas sp. PA5]
MPHSLHRYIVPYIALALGVTGQSQAGEGPAARDHSRSQGACEVSEMQREMLERVNAARQESRQCGDDDFDAARPVAWNCDLAAAAEAHSRDMAENDYFSHTDPEGEGLQARVEAESYNWRAIAENIAAGQESIVEVVEGWLASPGHCANLMNDTFTEMGMARIEEAQSLRSPYWTQVFARPR